MRIAIVLLCVVTVSARADGLYATPSAWCGQVGAAPDGTLCLLRFAGGVEGHDEARAGRLGLTLDLPSQSRLGNAAIGLEAELDWKLDAHWSVGPRLDRSLRSNQPVTMAGLRLRNDWVSVGVDAVYVSGLPYDDHAFGVLVGAGLEGKAGAITTGVAAGIAVVLALLVIHALANEGT